MSKNNKFEKFSKDGFDIISNIRSLYGEKGQELVNDIAKAFKDAVKAIDETCDNINHGKCKKSDDKSEADTKSVFDIMMEVLNDTCDDSDDTEYTAMYNDCKKSECNKKDCTKCTCNKETKNTAVKDDTDSYCQKCTSKNCDCCSKGKETSKVVDETVIENTPSDKVEEDAAIQRVLNGHKAYMNGKISKSPIPAALRHAYENKQEPANDMHEKYNDFGHWLNGVLTSYIIDQDVYDIEDDLLDYDDYVTGVAHVFEDNGHLVCTAGVDFDVWGDEFVTPLTEKDEMLYNIISNHTGFDVADITFAMNDKEINFGCISFTF